MAPPLRRFDQSVRDPVLSPTAYQAPLSWDQYFILIAFFTSLRSKDPRSKVGAVIVDSHQHIVGTGYNGFVRGTDEATFTWETEGEWLQTKYPYVVHAEQNAVLNATRSSLEDCVLYSTLFPCNECAKTIAQKGLRKVIYLSDKNHGSDQRKAAEVIFQASGVDSSRIELPPFEMLARSVLGAILTTEDLTHEEDAPILSGLLVR